MDVGTAINANLAPKLEVAVSRVEALGLLCMIEYLCRQV